MQALALLDVERLLEGHVDVRWRPGGIQPIRHPAPELLSAGADPLIEIAAKAKSHAE